MSVFTMASKSKKRKNCRISITISQEDLDKWDQYNSYESLSAFIRNAVNDYIKIQDPKKKQTFFDLFLEQQSGMRDIKESLTNIEGDLFEITASLAKKNIFPEPEKNIVDQRIIAYLNEQINQESQSSKKEMLQTMKKRFQRI